MPHKSLIGFRNERVEVIAEAPKRYQSGKWRHYYLVQCDCGGNPFEARAVGLTAKKNPQPKMCFDCARKLTGEKVKTHGMAGTSHPLYKVWNTMKQRCSNPNNEKYDIYGAKGIKVCKEWLLFEGFLAWSIENGYIHYEERKKKLTIERKDLDKDYCPENCCWDTYKVQNNNKSDTIRIILSDGTETGLKEAVNQFGAVVTYQTVRTRMHKGWSFERARLEPPQNNNAKKKNPLN